MKFLEIKPGVGEHHYVPGKNSVPCQRRWEDCSICVMQAKHRGMCINAIWACWRHRHTVHGEERTQVRLIVQLNARQLRDLGPGPVIMPGHNLLEPDIKWWGPRKPF